MNKYDTHYYYKSDELSPHDVKVLGVIRLYLRDCGRPPSYREIIEYTDTSKNTVFFAILRLTRLGYITRKPNKDGTILWTGKV